MIDRIHLLVLFFLFKKNPASGKSAGGGPKLAKYSTAAQKIDIDNKAHLR
jgi:hypothetical protein